jgi:hypothetical protein
MRLVLIVGVLALGVLVRVSAASGGLATADFMIRSLGRRADPALTGRVYLSGMSAAGIALGISLVCVGAALRLIADSNPADHVVVTLAGLSLLIRSRLFSGAWNGLVLVLVGGASLIGGLARLIGDHPSRSPWALPLGLSAVAAVLFAIVQSRGRRTNPSPNRALHWAESTAVTAMVCAGVIAARLLWPNI